jgi:hypothetical protein
MSAADVPALPRVSTDEHRDNVISWVHRLRSLSQYAEVTRSNAVRWRGQQGGEVEDTGGNTDLWKETKGTPRWGLVNDAILVYEIFKPGRATGTEGGPLHQFMLDVYEYATGLEGNIHAKLDDWLKKLVKANRKDRDARAQTAALDAEWDSILDLDPALRKQTHMQRINEISAEIKRLDRERRELWTITWPHVRLHQLGE